MFLQNWLSQLQRAAAEGVPVDAYFYWRSQDSFEWSAGFANGSG
jgi:beta-glucosidase